MSERGEGPRAIRASRRENLPWWGRVVLRLLPRSVYGQILVEYDIVREYREAHRG